MSTPRIVAWWSIVVWALGTVTLAEETESLAEHLPGESHFALITDNFGELAASFHKSNLGNMATGKDFQPLVLELQRRDQMALWHVRPWFGFDWEQMSDLAGPGAVVIFPYSKGQFGAACLFETAGSAEAKAQCLAFGERYFLAKKYRKVVVQGSGHEMMIYEPPAALKGEPARVHFTSGSLFGAANTRAAAEALLATKAATSLARQTSFQQLTAQESAGVAAGSARLYVRPFDLWSLSRQDRAKGKPSPRDSLVMARREGVEGLQAVGGVVRFPSDKSCDLDFSLRIALKSPLQRAMGLVDFKAGVARQLPEWVAADAASVLSWQWDFLSAMKAFGNLFDEYSEPGPDGDGLFDDLLSGLRDDPEGPRVDLRRELFPRLGPQVLSISDQVLPTEQNPSGQRTIDILACRESPQVAAILKKFYAGEKHVSYEKQGKNHVWTSKKGESLFVEGENETLIPIRGVAVTPGELLFSTDAALLRTALAGKNPATPLAKDPDWRQLQDWLSGSESERTAVRAFVRIDQFLEASYVPLRAGKTPAKESLSTSLLRLVFFGTVDKKPAPPLGSLPDFKKVREQLRPVGVRLSLTDDGWQIRGGILGRDQRP